MCIALCTIVAHNIAQNRPDNSPSYPPDIHHCSDDVYLREGEGMAVKLPHDVLLQLTFSVIMDTMHRFVSMLYRAVLMYKFNNTDH